MYTHEDIICVLVGLVIFLVLLLLANAWVSLSCCVKKNKNFVHKRMTQNELPRRAGRIFPDESDIEIALEIVNGKE